ncbi:nuclear transport factor 2 family protein [Nocardioides sp. Soil796]|uniref:nuclear transport factor 2 family protein n=1 Tax=Nocardioides sp. Soil796 TaxID=1736412 RepID=UPI000710A8D8|nr:nuclear transport factor 2 family protein [Nocardioides sp. Soil796]KRF10474.1 hypothetical protein ASH02_20445 [Nocardioides sp. Soil796]
MPTREEICRLCDGYIAALNRRDPESVIAFFAEDAVQEEPVGSAPNVGREAILAFFEGHRDAPITVTRFGPVNVVGNRAVFQAHVAIDTPDGSVAITTTDVIAVDDDCLISELLAFPDREGDPDDAPGARLLAESWAKTSSVT